MRSFYVSIALLTILGLSSSGAVKHNFTSRTENSVSLDPSSISTPSERGPGFDPDGKAQTIAYTASGARGPGFDPDGKAQTIAHTASGARGPGFDPDGRDYA